jgi:hypothetical protein
MAHITNSWNPLDWFKVGSQKKVKRNSQLVLESLEGREVPATLLVTNLLDSTNASFPTSGSLREALAKAKSGDEIRFDESLFPEGQGTKKLILNGAVGELVVLQNNVSIVGPGKFTTGSNEYKLQIQSDIGFAEGSFTNLITNGGKDYKPGDILDQGSTTFEGGAVFQVQAVNSSGAVTQIKVINPGANSVFTGLLSDSSSATGLNRLTPRPSNDLIPRVGSGLQLTITNQDKALASALVLSQIINATPQTLNISGIQFGDANYQAIIQNLGSLSLNDCKFYDDPNVPGATDIYISAAVGSGDISVVNSSFSGGFYQVSSSGQGTFTFKNSIFTEADGGASLGRAISLRGGGATTTIESCGFTLLDSGVYTTTQTATVNNSYFSSVYGGFAADGADTTVTNCYFADNKGVVVGINNHGNSIGTLSAYGGANLTVKKSLFLRNTISDIDNLNSGGAAIFNYSGILNIDQCGFSENSISITGYPNPDPNAPNFVDNPNQIPTAANSGGGAVFSGGTTTITNSYFNQNKVVSTVDFWEYTKLTPGSAPADSKPQYGGGGALYLTSNNGQTAQITLTNNTITQNSVIFDSQNATTVPYINIPATGSGLNGGALLIASGVDTSVSNYSTPRPFKGTTQALLVNNTITDNTLINDSVIGVRALSSNVRTVFSTTVAPAAGWLNPTDTGGLFNNTSNGSSVNFLNNIIINNTGIEYVSDYGNGTVAYSNTGSRYTQGTGEGGNGSLSSLGHNLFDNAFSYWNGGNYNLYRTTGDLVYSGTQPIFDIYGLRNNQGPMIGLITGQPTGILPDQGQGNILTIAIDRLSPARDAGNSSVYNTGQPVSLKTDARGVKRLINLAVDMGSYEVQTGTITIIPPPQLKPAEPPSIPNQYLLSNYGVPFSITASILPNDNIPSNLPIGGTAKLVSASNARVEYATGTVYPVSLNDPSKGGTVQFGLNSTLGNTLPAGTNDYIIVYNGSESYAISQSNVFSAVVSPSATETILNTGYPNPQGPNSDVIFTGYVDYFPSTSVPTGTITIRSRPQGSTENWANLVTTTLGVNGEFSVPAQFSSLGDFDVQAVFASTDTAKFQNSISNTVYQEIGYIPKVELDPIPFIDKYERGQDVTFTANVYYDPATGTPPGTVTFATTSGIQIFTVSPPTPSPAGTMTYTITLDPAMVPIGESQIVAIYNRDGGQYVSQESLPETLIITGRTTTTTLTASPTSGVYGSPVVFTALVSPGGPPNYAGGSVEFYAGSTLLQTLPLTFAGSIPQPVQYTTYGLQGGNYSVTARFTGDGENYLPSTSDPISLTISKAATQLGLKSNFDRVQVGTPITLTATLSNSAFDPAVQPTGPISFYLGGLLVGTSTLKGNTATLVVTPSETGTLVYEAKYAGTNNYAPCSGSTTVTAFQQTTENFFLVAPQQGPFVQMFDRITNQQTTVFEPFGPSYSGGFTVAKGDINSDGVADLLYSPRSGGQIQIYDGVNFNPMGTVYPFGIGLNSSLSIAVGDINGDGYGDVISAPSGIGFAPHVVAISGRDLTTTLFSQYAYAPQFHGGVSVAAGEVNGDGALDIITAPLVGAPPHIVTFNGRTGAVMQSYYAYSPLYMGGTSITAADLNGDGFTEIITGASAAAPHVVVVDARTMSVKASFYAYAPGFGGGVRVSTIQDVNGDGVNDILTAPGLGAGPNIVRFDGAKALMGQPSVIDSFFAYGPTPSLNYYGGSYIG